MTSSWALGILTPSTTSLGLALQEALPDKYNRVFVAYSGGVDSAALLHVASKLLPEITAIHVNHGLSPNADVWQMHCKQFCQNYNIPLSVFPVAIDETQGDSLEALARQARYEVFASNLDEGDILLLAQHQDDQAETVLLRLLRGSGPAGLAAMPKQRVVGEGMLLRPWLGESKAEILNYAKAQQLSWVEDESNKDTRFDRNFLREEVLPLLRTRWPGLNKTLTRSATLCRVLSDSVDGHAQETLSTSILLKQSQEQACLTVHTWLRQMADLVPSHKHIENIVSEVVAAKEDATPQVTWGDGQVRRFQGALYYLKTPVDLSLDTLIYVWQDQGDLVLAEPACHLQKVMQKGQGFHLPKGAKVEIRFYQGGEQIIPVGHQQSKKLKKLFQENSVPPWERRQVPLVYVDNILVQVVGLCMSAKAQVEEDKMGCEIVVL